MNVNTCINIFKKKFYIIENTVYLSESKEKIVCRLAAKHPQLKPEFLIEKDEIKGFQEVDESVKSLDLFPIFIELEGKLTQNGTYNLVHIELLSESNISCNSKVSDVIYLSKRLASSVSIERSFRLADTSNEYITIVSTINNYFSDPENFQEMKLSETHLEFQVSEFLRSIDLLDALIIKNMSIYECQKLL